MYSLHQFYESGDSPVRHTRERSGAEEGRRRSKERIDPAVFGGESDLQSFFFDDCHSACPVGHAVCGITIQPQNELKHGRAALAHSRLDRTCAFGRFGCRELSGAVFIRIPSGPGFKRKPQSGFDPLQTAQFSRRGPVHHLHQPHHRNRRHSQSAQVHEKQKPGIRERECSCYRGQGQPHPPVFGVHKR